MKRLVIYFHYDPRGQIDETCRIAVREIMGAAQAFYFVTNSALEQAAAQWLVQAGAQLRQRGNTGYDVAAYREILLELGRDGLEEYDEVILMNFTLAGPVLPISNMLAEMELRSELDFWGLTRHYQMKSRRFRTKYGLVPEHIQSHFIALRPRLFKSEEFWAYWQAMPAPQSYEQAVALHEAVFTRHFADMGYRWDTYIDTSELKQIFVNPIMACPAYLIRAKGCPFFKRRSFFTPYADELRRTDGRVARQLYDYLKTETDYPVDTLVRELLQTQPLAALAKNLHWHYILSAGGAPGAAVELVANEYTESGAALENGKIYKLHMPGCAAGTAAWYTEMQCKDEAACRAAALFATYPMLGVLGSALPLYKPAAQQRLARWKNELPQLKARMAQLGISVPLDEASPLSMPNGGTVYLRGAAFPQGLPPLNDGAAWWLLPLIAQQNGYYTAEYEDESTAAARAAIMAEWQAADTLPGAAKALARAIKRRAAGDK